MAEQGDVRVDDGSRDGPRLPERFHSKYAYGRSLTAPVSPTACWTGLLFFALSLSPTLLPRAGWAQGAITAISTMTGVALGALLASIGRGLWRAAGRDVPRPLGAWGRRVFAAVAVVVVVGGLIWWIGSQNDQRDLVLMEHIGAGSLPLLVVAAVVVGAILFVVGRTIAHFVRRLDEAVTSAVPRWAAIGVTVVAVAAFGTVVTRDVVWKQFVDWANSTYGTFDDETPPGIAQPTSPLRSGSPESLVAWDTLGYEGRNFTGGGPTVDQIQQFAGAGTPAKEPIRVYAGLQSADGQEAQAQLAVDELERTGAFDRSVLAVVTVTGTGWVDPVAAASLEYMHHGDTAIVGTQYSYLPSWISFLVDLDKAEENGRVLVDAVTRRWEQLPAASRPELLVYGISLGSYGSEHAYDGSTAAASLDDATGTAGGVLWAGPTFFNPIWTQVVDARDTGSPAWHPEFLGGEQLTVMGSPDEAPVAQRLSPDGHVVYLTHPSDPVTWASFDALWRPPTWMQKPRGYDVPQNGVWAPGVTFTQELFDLMAGFSATPGHGHNYDPNVTDGWAAVSAPPGWTAADTARLDALLNPPTGGQ
jgi:uncharacterized membrane protein